MSNAADIVREALDYVAMPEVHRDAVAALDALVAEREKWEALFFAAEITRDRAVAERDEAQAEAERWKRATAEEKGLREGEEDRADHLRYLLDTTTGPKKLEAAEAERDAWKVEALHHNAEEIRLREALEAVAAQQPKTLR